MDFHGFDLNLLVAFDALMRERNVTRAATQVGVSQPAMSAALSRLRNLLGDPLFLRSANGLLPTLRARDIAEPVSQALEQLASTLSKNPGFEPSTCVMTVRLGMQDYPAFVLMPTLVEALVQEAPGLTLNIHAFNNRDHAVDLLDAGIIDIAMGVPPTRVDGRILTRLLLRDDFVTIVSSSNPAASHGMDLKTYLALSHVLVSPEGDQFGLVDQALAKHGQERRLALTLPQMFAVPGIVARTDLTATILKRAAKGWADSGLVSFKPPVDLPSVEFSLIWHRRCDAHPAQRWFRDFVSRHAALL
jgi:DNA-binding transcriptional LysR family regulator